MVIPQGASCFAKSRKGMAEEPTPSREDTGLLGSLGSVREMCFIYEEAMARRKGHRTSINSNVLHRQT
jgi:hypothetical protein